jgi:hypothetical protein
VKKFFQRNTVFVLALFAWVPIAPAVTMVDDFSTDPLARDWKIFNQTNLFHWNATNGNVEVTWDSSQPNSYFYRPLGTVLTKQEDFSFSFDLRLLDAVTGVNPSKPSTFQLAVALVNLTQATRSNYYRGTGASTTYGARSVVEFDYFPDSESGFGETISPTVVSSNTQFATGFNFPIPLTTNDVFHIAMTFTASNRTLVTTLSRNGAPYNAINNVVLGGTFTDFRIDHIAVCSYNDTGQDPQYGGSLLAHGLIDNIEVQLPWLPVESLHSTWTNGNSWTDFFARTNWFYTLERSTNSVNWTPVSPRTAGSSGNLSIMDSNAPPERAFYRVKAERQ